MQLASCPRGTFIIDKRFDRDNPQPIHFMLHDLRLRTGTVHFPILCSPRNVQGGVVEGTDWEDPRLCSDCLDVYYGLMKRRYRGTSPTNPLNHWDKVVLSWISDAPELKLLAVQGASSLASGRLNVLQL